MLTQHRDTSPQLRCGKERIFNKKITDRVNTLVITLYHRMNAYPQFYFKDNLDR